MQFDLLDDELLPVLSSTSYEEFREHLLASDCRRCPLHEGRTNLVPDRGNPRARLVFIGEGPGADEDAQGRAFVGRAGQLLDKFVAGIELDTNEDCLILNVVKCRPPKNRAPTRDEAKTCSVFLERQLELVKPRIVALLGATALKHLDPRKKTFSMADEVGRFFRLDRWPEIEFMVLYHPAAMLYDPGKKPAMAEHMERLKARLGELEGV